MSYRLRAILLAPALVVAASLAAQQRQAPALDRARVEAIAKQAYATFKPKGMALAVVQDGEVLAELAFGERKPGVPVTERTLFNIASCSKAFTAALVAQMVAAGKLGWNDRVVDRLPEFKMADPWITAHMTLADLLSHRCGLKTFAGDLLWYGTDRDDAQVLARIEALPITQRFREEYGYQNLMYMAAGMVLQRATDKPWEQLVEERLMAPLGMSGSRSCLQRVGADADVASPFIDGQEIGPAAFQACKAAGAIYASVHDLCAWMRMLLDGGKWEGKALLDQKAIAEMWRPHVAIGAGSGPAARDLGGYGMGWFLRVEDGKKLVEHDGGMPGFLSKVSLLPADRFGFAVLNNGNDGIVNEALKRALYAAHRGADPMAEIERLAGVGKRIADGAKDAVTKREAARIEGTKPTLALERYTGDYEDKVDGAATVVLDGGALRLALVPAAEHMSGKLVHWHHDVFRMDFPDRFLPFALITFELDHAGRVSGFKIDCPIDDFDFAALDYRRVAPKAARK